MKITDIDLSPAGWPKLRDEFGLTSPIRMPRLGKIVVLAGRNGSGKTRLLRALRGVYDDTFFQNPESAYQRQIEILQMELEKNQKKIEKQEASNLAGIPTPIIDHNKEERARLVNALHEQERKLAKRRQVRDEWTENFSDPVFFTPESARLTNPDSFNDEYLQNLRSSWEGLHLSDTENGVPGYIKSVFREGAFAELDRYRGTATTDDERAIQAAEELRSIIVELLGSDSNPTFTKEHKVKIFDRIDYTQKLSAGQKVLLILATALHGKGTRLSEALLFLDEPENHLHPKALHEVIDKLSEKVTNGQIWIATHAISLIARLTHKDPACLWFAHEGTFTHAGKRPEDVLGGLIGDEEEVAKLRDFADLPARLAANRFAAECLLDPTTVAARVGDKQQEQMVGAVLEIKSEKKVRVLDCGSGQGRLLAALNDAGALSRVEYFAYDLQKNDTCRKLIEALYGEGAANQRYFTDKKAMLARAGYVDVIVMCNVLHEIPPSSWIDEIGPNSRLMELLADDGYLLVVEDQRIPVGENAHDYGFLVFDTLQFQKLFSFTSSVGEDLYKKSDAYAGNVGKEGRLLAHRFAKKLVINLSTSAQRKAIVDLYKSAAEEMKMLRQKGEGSCSTFEDGQQHAFWMTQYANAALWLSSNGVISFSDN